ncbi:MAG: hypothetical protein WA268_13180 [Xanthobacteraceae bacterium]
MSQIAVNAALLACVAARVNDALAFPGGDKLDEILNLGNPRVRKCLDFFHQGFGIRHDYLAVLSGKSIPKRLPSGQKQAHSP